LRAKKLRPTEIGRLLGITQRQVSNLARSKRRACVNFPLDILKLLEPHAAEREMSVSGLAIAIVFAAVDDGLVDSLLDDR
jgi:predicted transcriptional regulator